MEEELEEGNGGESEEKVPMDAILCDMFL